jgi:hypothetical protein
MFDFNPNCFTAFSYAWEVGFELDDILFPLVLLVDKSKND